LTTRNSNPF